MKIRYDSDDEQIRELGDLLLEKRVADNPAFPDDVFSDGTVFSSMTSLTGWTVSNGIMELDTVPSHIINGVSAIKVSNTSDAFVYITYTFSKTFSSSDVFVFPIFIDNMDKFASGTVKIMISSTVDFSKFMQANPVGTRLHQGKNLIIIPASEFTADSGETWENTMIRMRLRYTPAVGQLTFFSWGQINLNRVTKSKALITFDDARTSAYEIAFPQMLKRSLLGTMYVIPDRVGTSSYMTEAQLKKMYDAGWDLGNHTKSHAHLRDIPYADAVAEITYCTDWLEARGWTRASRHLAYPFGEMNDSVVLAARESGILSARRASYTGVAPQPRPIYDPYRIDSVLTMGSTSTDQIVKEAIDRAILHGAMPIFYCHEFADVPTGDECPTSVFVYMLDYLISVGIQPTTISRLIG
jgi:peptidoglycan/xylan/chitin deacetylase (PgdA/CDA1 family)